MASDKPIYRMSAAGSCPRALSAERLGIQAASVPPWLELSANEGRRHEQWVKEDLRKEGYEIEDCALCPVCWKRYGVERQGIHIELEFDSFLFVGHLDGRFSKDGKRGGLEIKSMSQYEFNRWMKGGFGEFPEYLAQLISYMVADHQTNWLYVVKNRSSGYQERLAITSNSQGITVANLATNRVAALTYSFSSIVEMITAVEKHITQEKTPYPAEFDANSLQCKRCFYKHLCVKTKEELTKATEEQLRVASSDWRKGRALIEEGEQLIASAKEVIMEHTIASKESKWQFDELAITFVHVPERISYPTKNLLAMFTEEQLKPAGVLQAPYDYLKITDLREE